MQDVVCSKFQMLADGIIRTALAKFRFEEADQVASGDQPDSSEKQKHEHQDREEDEEDEEKEEEEEEGEEVLP